MYCAGYNILLAFLHSLLCWKPQKMEETQLSGPLRGPGYQEVMWYIRRRQAIYKKKNLNCFLQQKAGP